MNSSELSKLGFGTLLDAANYAGKFERKPANIPGTMEKTIPFHHLLYTEVAKSNQTIVTSRKWEAPFSLERAGGVEELRL